MTNKIPLTIAYDFDGTLALGIMQEHSFIPELEIPKEKFWHESRDVYVSCEVRKLGKYDSTERII